MISIPLQLMHYKFDLYTITHIYYIWLVDWMCLASHRQRGHLETTPLFTVPCERREVRFLHRFHQESNPGPSHVHFY